ncbi:hypothetical protein N1F89_08915 [Aquibium sp. A9E412]|nr:hypothetical protein [Aquibium sp. A9E412]MDN2566341.1 hypothetical protein [Aquibium sp. A9E412]
MAAQSWTLGGELVLSGNGMPVRPCVAATGRQPPAATGKRDRRGP